MIYLTLFWEFAKVAIFCVGGGYASMPLIQAAVVDTYHWLTLSEFVDIFTIGAVSATIGFCTPSFILGILLARLFFKYGDIGPIRGILNGLRPAVIALIASAGISFIVLALWNEEKLPADLSTIDPIGILILAVSLIAVRQKAGVIKLLAASGIAGLALGIVKQLL